jgi:hypothetical protein
MPAALALVKHMESDLPHNAPRPFRVLALDGGGIRGLYTATLLQKLEGYFAHESDEPMEQFGTRFDLITGTSTGGILACGLAGRIPIQEIIDLYEKYGPAIFKNPKPSGRISSFLWACRHFLAAANKTEPLRKGLKEIFGDTTVGELYNRNRIALCIPSIKMLNQCPKVFKTPHGPHLRIDGRYRVVDVCLATSAAPVFLPLARLEDPQSPGKFDHFADGGLWANNPTLVGLLEALEICELGDLERRRNIEVLSIGTCGLPNGDRADNVSDRGLAQWMGGIKTTTLAMNASAAGMEYMADLLARRITALGRKVSVERIENPAVSTDQAKHLEMDLATEASMGLLKQLGSQRAEDLMREWGRPDSPRGQLIKQIFSDSQPQLQTL